MMRFFWWLGLGFVACSGAEFTSDNDPGGETGGTAGTASSGGSSNGGAASGGNAGTGGSVSTGGSTSSGRSTGANGGSGGAVVIRACPEEPPSVDSSCQTGLVCTYGDDPRFDCRDRYTCMSGGWLLEQTACPEVPQCIERNDQPSLGGPCDELGDTCYYDDGEACVCLECTDEVCLEEFSWECFQASEPCPEVPPNVGQPCEGVGQCQYAECPSDHYAVLSCEASTWSQADVVCAD